MHSYDFRCKNCQHEFTLHYKSYQAYDEATPICPQCEATELSRIIRKVAVQNPTRDFTQMSSQEMLSVFESGDSKQVGQMFDQIGGSSPELGIEYHEATQRLMKGESMDSVEKDLANRQKNDTSTSD